MKIKVCGITRVDQMQQLAQMDVDYAGIIFYPGSERFAGDVLYAYKNEMKATNIKKIGVFVNANLTDVLDAVNDYGLYAVQLHGHEDAAYCKQLMKLTNVIKAIRIAADSDVLQMIAEFTEACDYYLFDTATEHFGGSGNHFDWNLLANANIKKPFFLSGGLSIADADAIKNMKDPFLHSIDINSRFETTPGVKDLALIKSFLCQLNN